MSRPYSEPLTGGRVLSRDLPSSPSHVNSHSQASFHSALQPKPLERAQNWGKITSKFSTWKYASAVLPCDSLETRVHFHIFLC